MGEYASGCFGSWQGCRSSTAAVAAQGGWILSPSAGSNLRMAFAALRALRCRMHMHMHIRICPIALLPCCCPSGIAISTLGSRARCMRIEQTELCKKPDKDLYILSRAAAASAFGVLRSHCSGVRSRRRPDLSVPCALRYATNCSGSFFPQFRVAEPTGGMTD